MKVEYVVAISGHGEPLVNGVNTTKGKGLGKFREGRDNRNFTKVLCKALAPLYKVQDLIGTCPLNISLGQRLKGLNLFKPSNSIGIGIHANAGQSKARGHVVFFKKWDKKSKILAQCISDELDKKSAIPSRGIKTQGFFMLRKPKITYVLLERFFFTNDTDREVGISEHQIQSDCIKRGIVKFEEVTEGLGLK